VWLLQKDLDSHSKPLPTVNVAQSMPSEHRSREVLDMIRNNARRIHDRVREIADAVNGASCPLQLGPCHIANVGKSVSDTLNVVANEKGVTLNMEGLEVLPAIQADEARLFNAFYNLINNAIPEVPAGGSITVRGHVDSKAKAVILSFADTGRGMSPQVRESLFTNRVVSRKVGGTGLGTKIVKDVVDLHGGSITVESKEREGTTFHLRLPIDGPQLPA